MVYQCRRCGMFSVEWREHFVDDEGRERAQWARAVGLELEALAVVTSMQSCAPLHTREELAAARLMSLPRPARLRRPCAATRRWWATTWPSTTSCPARWIRGSARPSPPRWPPPSMRTPSNRRRVALIAAVLAALLTACGSTPPPPAPDLVIGADAADPDSLLLAHVYAAALRYYGTPVRVQTFADPLAELDSGAATIVPGRTGAVLTRLAPGVAGRGDEQVYKAMIGVLPEGVTAGDYTTAAEDKPALAVTKATAKTNGKDI